MTSRSSSIWIRALVGSSLLLAAACERKAPSDPVPGPTDLSTTGNPVPPAATYGTGDSADRAEGLPGTADTGAMHNTSGFVTSGPMGLGGPGYTTGTTSAAGNQGIPTTMANPYVRGNEARVNNHTGVAAAPAPGRAQDDAFSGPRPEDVVTRSANTGSSERAGDEGAEGAEGAECAKCVCPVAAQSPPKQPARAQEPRAQTASR